MSTLKVGHRVSRMGGSADDRRPRRGQPPLQLLRKDQIGQLGLRVSLKHRLVLPLALQVFEVDLSLLADPTGQGDDA